MSQSEASNAITVASEPNQRMGAMTKRPDTPAARIAVISPSLDIRESVISVAASILSVHPRTLRIYEVEGLIAPARTRTNIRLYSENDIRRVLWIRHLTQNLGVNLAGVRILFELEERLGTRILEALYDEGAILMEKVLRHATHSVAGTHQPLDFLDARARGGADFFLFHRAAEIFGDEFFLHLVADAWAEIFHDLLARRLAGTEAGKLRLLLKLASDVFKLGLDGGGIDFDPQEFFARRQMINGHIHRKPFR